MTTILQCPCGASAKDTSKERGRFLRRHMDHCTRPVRDKRVKEMATVNNVVMDDDAPDTPELRARSRE